MLEIRNIETHPYDEKLFEKDTLTLTNKVTVLSGPNGYGKTTLMRELKTALKANGAIQFDNNPRSRKLSFSASGIFQDKNIDQDATIGFCPTIPMTMTTAARFRQTFLTKILNKSPFEKPLQKVKTTCFL